MEKDCNIDIDNREDAIHIGVYRDEKLISIGSLFEMSNKKLSSKRQYRLRAMATHPNYREQNAGKILVEYAVKIIQEKKYDILWCDAREVALGFYSKLGFQVVGDWYEVPNVGKHKTMFFELRNE